MKKAAIALSLGMIACSGVAEDVTSPEEIAERTQAIVSSLSSQIEHKARIVGTRKWKRTIINFVAEGPDNGSPIDSSEYSITRIGPISDGDIVGKIYASTDIPLSPAEIWLALDDDNIDDLPSELAAHHLRWTVNGASKPRTNEFNRISARGVDQVDKYVSEITWQNQVLVPIPAHTYSQTRFSQRQNFQGGVSRHTCLEARSGNVPPHDLSGSGLTNQACWFEHYQTGWVRHAIANIQNEPGIPPGSFPPAPPMAVVPCAGWWEDPQQIWYCEGPYVVNSDFYVLRDSTAQALKAIAMTYTHVAPMPVVARVYALSTRVSPN